MRFFIVVIALLMSSTSFAASSPWTMGVAISQVSASQADLNELQKRANARVGISTGQIGNALEFFGFIERRFGKVGAIHFRPSYFMQSTTGSGGAGATAGTYAYSVSGFSMFPLLRAYILESSSVKLYTQAGVGWGYLSGKIDEGPVSAKFAGSNFGFQGGLGVEFCLGKGTHCFFTEGNARYLYIERNIVDEKTGTFATGANAGATGEKANELELDGRDLGTTMSGVQALLGYSFHF